MTRKAYLHPSVTRDRVIHAVRIDDCLGFCRACGDDAYDVEPDARGYRCESCGSKAVMGAEELLMELVV